MCVFTNPQVNMKKGRAPINVLYVPNAYTNSFDSKAMHIMHFICKVQLDQNAYILKIQLGVDMSPPAFSSRALYLYEISCTAIYGLV